MPAEATGAGPPTVPTLGRASAQHRAGRIRVPPRDPAAAIRLAALGRDGINSLPWITIDAVHRGAGHMGKDDIA